MPSGPERAPSSPSPPGGCACCRVRRGVPVGLVRATPGCRRSSGAGCVPGGGSACHAPRLITRACARRWGVGARASRQPPTRSAAPPRGWRLQFRLGGASTAVAALAPAGGGRVPQQPGPRRGRGPGQTEQGCAPAVTCPCCSSASATASQAEPAVRGPGMGGAPRVGLPYGVAARGSRYPHATAVSQVCTVGVASRSQVVGVVAWRRVCGGPSVRVHMQARGRGRVGAEQRTGADRATGSLCCKSIVRGAAAHRGR